MKIINITIGGDPKLTEIFNFCKGMPKRIKAGLSLDDVVNIIEKKLKEIEFEGSVKNNNDEFIIIEFSNKLMVVAGDVDGVVFSKIQQIIDKSGKTSQSFYATVTGANFS